MEPYRAHGTRPSINGLACLTAVLLGIAVLSPLNPANAADGKGGGVTTFSVMPGRDPDRSDLSGAPAGGSVVLRGTRPPIPNASQFSPGDGGGGYAGSNNALQQGPSDPYQQRQTTLFSRSRCTVPVGTRGTTSAASAAPTSRRHSDTTPAFARFALVDARHPARIACSVRTRCDSGRGRGQSSASPRDQGRFLRIVEFKSGKHPRYLKGGSPNALPEPPSLFLTHSVAVRLGWSYRGDRRIFSLAHPRARTEAADCLGHTRRISGSVLDHPG